METEVIMERQLFDGVIKQRSKSEFFSVTDLVKSGNRWRLENNLSPFDFNQWRQSNQTKEFMSALESKFGTVLISARGRGHDTWVHPFIFLDVALAINPTLKIEVYDWLYDCLLRYRNDSGDSYKLMAGALYANTTQHTTFGKSMSILCRMIQSEVGVSDWQKATESDLSYRDKIHEYIALMCGMFNNNNNEAIRMGMLKAREWKNNRKIE